MCILYIHTNKDRKTIPTLIFIYVIFLKQIEEQYNKKAPTKKVDALSCIVNSDTIG